MVSSKGGHSFQLVTQDKGFFLKFWLVGIQQPCDFNGDSKNIPHITLQVGKKGNTNILKESAEVKVQLKKYVPGKGKAQIAGSITGDWQEKGNIKIEFDVTVEDIGII